MGRGNCVSFSNYRVRSALLRRTRPHFEISWNATRTRDMRWCICQRALYCLWYPVGITAEWNCFGRRPGGTGKLCRRLLRDNFLSLFCGLPQLNVKTATQRFMARPTVSRTTNKQAESSDWRHPPAGPCCRACCWLSGSWKNWLHCPRVNK